MVRGWRVSVLSSVSLLLGGISSVERSTSPPARDVQTGRFCRRCGAGYAAGYRGGPAATDGVLVTWGRGRIEGVKRPSKGLISLETGGDVAGGDNAAALPS
jgi:hypothetical protein